jgi:hypothetical protein
MIALTFVYNYEMLPRGHPRSIRMAAPVADSAIESGLKELHFAAKGALPT